MPEVRLTVGGRDYEVSCKAGEEESLEQASALLDAEAKALLAAIGRVPEPRMLLMSGLMLADRTTELAYRVQEMEQELETLRAQLGGAEVSGAPLEPVLDPAVLSALRQVTERAEALAAED